MLKVASAVNRACDETSDGDRAEEKTHVLSSTSVVWFAMYKSICEYSSVPLRIDRDHVKQLMNADLITLVSSFLLVFLHSFN